MQALHNKASELCLLRVSGHTSRDFRPSEIISDAIAIRAPAANLAVVVASCNVGPHTQHLGTCGSKINALDVYVWMIY